MKALIIGGTKGIGKEIAKAFSSKGYEIITVSRSKADYNCDVGKIASWKKILKKIKKEHDQLDAIACVVGYARAKPSKKLTKKDWQITLNRNLTYVELTFKELSSTLLKSKNPLGITLGSQWSYKTGCDELVPYIEAKHKLIKLTKEISRKNPKLIINNYCLPTTNTPEYREVIKSFKKLGKGKIIKQIGIADPKVIGKSIVKHLLKTKDKGKILVVSPKGRIRHLNPKDL